MKEFLLLRCYRGSISHGMYEGRKSIDDVDMMDVIAQPLDDYLMKKEYGSRGTKELKNGDTDLVTYEVSKYFYMLKKNNPNIITLLFADPENIVEISPVFGVVYNMAGDFICERFFKSLVGYARAQRKKMVSAQKYQGYMGKKRKEMVDKYGYDTKNASHLIRLLRMGKEYIEHGTIFTNRVYIDADELLDIKHGKWDLRLILQHAQSLEDFILVNETKMTLKKKEEVDKLVDDLHRDLIREVFNIDEKQLHL